MKSTRREFSWLYQAGRAVLILAVFVLLAAGKNYTILSHAQASATVKAASAKVRSGADTGSDVVAGVKKDDVLTVTGEKTDGQGYTWYEVIVDGNTKGYIRADLVDKSGSLEKAPTVKKTEETAAKVTETAADVTESSYTSGSIIAESVNVRKGPSATDAVVASVKKDTVVSITGEAKGADGKPWYQVTCLNNNNEVTGFIRSDLLTPSAESAETESPEAEGTEAEDGSEGDELQPEDLPAEEPENHTEISNVVSSRIIPDGMKIEDMKIDADTLAGWQSGNYFMLYTKDTDGVDAWYLYDIAQGISQKLDTSVFGGGEDKPEDTGLGDTGKLIVIILAALLIVMIIVCTVLFIKLRSDRWDDEDEEEEDDEEEEEDEDDGRVKRGKWKPRNFLRVDDEEEEEDEDEEEEIPVRRPVKKAPPKQAPRKTTASTPANAPQRASRPAPQGQAAPARRPAPQGQGRPAPQGTARSRSGEVIREKKPVPRQAPPSGREGAPRQQSAPRQGAPVKQGAARPAQPRQRPAGERPAAPMKQTPPKQVRKYQPDIEDDDEFEFGFLNMDGKDDL